MGLFSKLAGTILPFFEYGGPTGPGTNQNGAALETRNAANSTFAIHRVADPVGPNDAVNLESLVAAPGTVNTIRIPVGLVTVSSTKSIPATAIVQRAYLVASPGTAWSLGTNITLGTAANATLFMGATDSAPTVAGQYDAPQDTLVAVANPLLVTVNGGPAAGGGFACVVFAIPLT